MPAFPPKWGPRGREVRQVEGCCGAACCPCPAALFPSSLASFLVPCRVPREKVQETSDILLNCSLGRFLPWAPSQSRVFSLRAGARGSPVMHLKTRALSGRRHICQCPSYRDSLPGPLGFSS